MKVLSLFDGMSCGQIALKQLGIIPEVYYASEIDKHAIKQTQLNFPDTIQLGDVTKWKKWDIDWKSIDLVLAGSPCQGFSFAGKQLAFDDPRSKLFFVFIDILNHIRSLNPDVLFLLENVNMKKAHMRIISEYCGVFPVNINSNLVSAQNRDRWYWTNIRTKQVGLFGEVYTDIPQPEDKGIFLRDILEEEVDEKYYVSQAVIDRMMRKNYSKPSINPEKTGTLNTKNNSASMSIDSGTTFISIDGKAPTQRVATGRSLDRKHNYQFIKLNIEGKVSPNQNKSSCFAAGAHSGGYHSDMDLICVAMRGRNPDNPSDRRVGSPTEQRLEPNTSGKTNCLTTVQKDNLIVEDVRVKGFSYTDRGIRPHREDYRKSGVSEYGTILYTDQKSDTHIASHVGMIIEKGAPLSKRQNANYKSADQKANAFLSTSHKGSQANGMTLVRGIIQLNPSKDSGGVQPYQQDRIYDVNGIAPALCSGHGGMGCNVNTDRIRRLTPTECARLQTIPDWYKWECSDTQQYRMLGNGWTVDVIAHILSFIKDKFNINVA